MAAPVDCYTPATPPFLEGGVLGAASGGRVGEPGQAGQGGAVAWQLELPWPPVTGNRAVRHGMGGHYRHPKYVEYLGIVKRIAEKHKLAGKLYTGPYSVELTLCPPNRRDRDGDNLEKVLWDSIVKAGILADDNRRVLQVVVRRWVEPAMPGAVLVVARAA